MNDQSKDKADSKFVHCLSCDQVIKDPSVENMMGDEYLCNKCREEMLSSLEDAWKKHSAFLDSALN